MAAADLLTTAKLKSLTIKDIGCILNDGGGLRGRVRKNRAGDVIVHFEYKYRAGKNFRTTKVEHWPRKSLAEIRVICRGVKSDLASGVDPIERRRSERLESQLEQAQQIEHQKENLQRLAAEAASRRTLTLAIEQWEKRELSRRKDHGKEPMRAIRKDILPVLGDVSLVDITRTMLVDVFDAVVERGSPVMANHLFGDLRQFFNFAIARDWIKIHPLAGLTKEKVGGRQNERDRYLSESELIELKGKLPSANLQETTELAIWIMLSTCCRVGELSQARWEDFDLDQGEWLIPASNSKNAKDHTIYLSNYAKNAFEQLRSVSGMSLWCLPSRDENQHICLKAIAKQIKDRTRDKPLSGRTKAAGTLLLSGGSWTPHDLRRTGATMMGELGVTGDVIERCLNHVEQNKLKRIYQRHELKAEQREAWRLLGDRLDLLKTVNTNGKVVVAQFNQRA